MPSFTVVWSRHRPPWRRDEDRAPWVLQAVLTERIILSGQPHMRFICNIASINEDQLGDISASDHFWHSVRHRLGRLYRLDVRDIDAIEAMIAAKVPKPVPSHAVIAKPDGNQNPSGLRPAANPIAGPHQPLRGQALRRW